MLALHTWLWIISIVATFVLSVGFSIFTLSTSRDRAAEAFLMLPAELLPDSAPSVISKIFLALFGFGVVVFLGSLAALFFFQPWGYVLVAGVILFLVPSNTMSWWIRDVNQRPMKSLLITSATLLAVLVVAAVDVLVHRV